MFTRYACEPFEPRLLLCLSHPVELPPAPKFDWAIEQAAAEAQQARGGPAHVDIIWANKNSFTGTADNFFDEVFGPGGPGTTRDAAQAVVEAVFNSWERIITSWNRMDGTIGFLVNVTMNMDPLNGAGFGGAGAPDPTAPADGKPRTGSFTINRGNDSADPDDNNGWFLDPTPMDYSEFTGAITNAYAGGVSTVNGADLYSLVGAELTHVLGLISDPGDSGGGFQGYLLEDSPFVTNTGLSNANGVFWTFDGPNVEHLMTSVDGGSPGPGSWGNIVHSAQAGSSISFAGKTWTSANDVGNPFGFAGRMIPGYTMAHMLGDAYGYSIADPAQFGTMYAVMNDATGALLVRGGEGLSNDEIAVSIAGTDLFVSVDVGADVAGSGALAGAGNLPAFVSEFNLSQVSSLTINAGDGNDTIFIDSIDSATPTFINAGTGNDFIHLANLGQNLDAVDANISINGDGGTDEMLLWDQNNGFNDAYTITTSSFTRTAFPTVTIGSTTELLDLFCGTGNNTINVNGTRAGSDWWITGGNGNDTLNWGNAGTGSVSENDGTALFDGQGNTDTVNFIDNAVSANLIYTVTNTTAVRAGTATLSYSNAESLTLNAGSGSDTINVNTGPGNIVMTLNANSGNDTFNVNPAAYTAAATNGIITLNGGVGTNDTVNVNDQANAATTTHAILNNSFNRTNTPNYNYGTVEGITVNGGTDADIVLVVSTVATTPVIVHGNNGADDIHIGNAVFGSSLNQVLGAVSAFGEGGTDTVQVWDTSNTSPNTFTVGFDTVDSGTSAPTTFQTAESVTINAGEGNDTFTVSGVAGVPVVINGNDGGDTFNANQTGAFNVLTLNGGNDNDILNVATGNLDQVQGTVNFDGGAATDSITLNDSSSILSVTYTITNALFDRNPGTFGTLNHSSSEAITVHGGTQNDNFNLSTSNGSPTLNLNGNNGSDTFNVNPAGYTAVASNGNITLNGGIGTDTLNFNDQTSAVSTFVGIGGASFSRSVSPTYLYNAFESFNYNAGPNGETISIGSTAPATPIALNAGGGADNITINGTDPAAPVTIVPSTGNDTVNVNTDNSGTARAVFSATQRIGALSIGIGGTAQLPAGGDKLLTISSLTLSGTGKLDLNDNDMIVDYTGLSPLANVQALINLARNGGAWDGNGITSSTAATNPADNTTLGAMLSTDYDAIYGAGALFDGIDPDATAVLVKYTYYGDANFSGTVNFDDYVRTDIGFNTGLSGWSNGDFNGNGVVNFDDYVLLDIAFNTQASPL